MGQYIFIVLAIIFYILRFVSQQRKSKQEAVRRSQQIPPPPITTSGLPPATAPPQTKNEPQPKTIDEILREMHRRVETQAKPYSQPATQQPLPNKTLVKKEAVKPKPKIQERKEPEPFLAEEYSAYKIAEAKIPSNMAEDFIKKGELADVYNEPLKKSVLKNFNVRDAVMAQIILQRPEW